MAEWSSIVAWAGVQQQNILESCNEKQMLTWILYSIMGDSIEEIGERLFSDAENPTRCAYDVLKRAQNKIFGNIKTSPRVRELLERASSYLDIANDGK